MRILHQYRLRPFDHRVIFDVNPGSVSTHHLAPSKVQVTVSHTDPTDGGKIDFDGCSPMESLKIDTHVSVRGLENFNRLCLGLTSKTGDRLLQAQWATQDDNGWSATFPATDYLSDRVSTYCLTGLNLCEFFPEAMPPRSFHPGLLTEYDSVFLNQETDHLDIKVMRIIQNGISDLFFPVIWQFVDMRHAPVFLQADGPGIDPHPLSGGFKRATFRIYPAGSMIQATLLNPHDDVHGSFENLAYFQSVPLGQMSIRLMMPEASPAEGWFAKQLPYETVTFESGNWEKQIADLESQGIDDSQITWLKAWLQTQKIIG